jgi:hypothetical protein
MGKINNYTVGSVNPGDKILTSDASTGDTKNITAQSIVDLERSGAVYRAYLKQVSSTAPNDTLVQGNTITGSWSYVGTGEYLFTSTGSFSGYVGCIIGISGAQDTTFEFSITSANSVTLKSYSAGVLADGLMNELYVEIFTHTI